MHDSSDKLAGYVLNATPDIPDARDLIYRPTLEAVLDEVKPEFQHIEVLDQGKEGACTGFGLAAVLNFLDKKRQLLGAQPRGPVSARMLYEMARKFDEWPGEDYSGSSCRGAIKGWQNMGVCEDSSWPYKVDDPGYLSLEAAKQARFNKPGAYYRLSPILADYHAAIHETGAIFVSARVHKGWSKPDITSGEIIPHGQHLGGHAFAIVGYNQRGFWVQNSWGEEWGRSGLALWLYEDWQSSVTDGWVVRFAVKTASAAHQIAFANDQHSALPFKKVRRSDIAEHFVHLDDGQFCSSGKYFSSIKDVQQISQSLGKSGQFGHLLLYAHGGLNSPSASAKRVNAMRNVFLANGIYPLHFMYDTGLMEEIKDVVLRNGGGDRTSFFSDIWDRSLEGMARPIGRALWREMKLGASRPFATNGAGRKVIDVLIGSLPSNIKIHLVGHSNGGSFMAHLLNYLFKALPHTQVASCSLMAPACTVEDFNKYYNPLLCNDSIKPFIDDMVIYNLTDEIERSDNVAGIYRKSLLYLVSNAFEEKRNMPLLGMENYSAMLHSQRIEFVYSEGKQGHQIDSQSESHGGFDNDPATMNHILQRVLDVSNLPPVHFTNTNLDY